MGSDLSKFTQIQDSNTIPVLPKEITQYWGLRFLREE